MATLVECLSNPYRIDPVFVREGANREKLTVKKLISERRLIRLTF